MGYTKTTNRVIVLIITIILLLLMTVPTYGNTESITNLQQNKQLNIENRTTSYIDDMMSWQKAKQEKAQQERLKQIKEQKKKEIKRPTLKYSAFTTSNLSISQFNKILQNTGLAGYGSVYYDIEKKFHINGLFAIAVMAQESGHGKYPCNTNNFYGFRGSNGWMSFDSPASCIYYFADLMTNHYKGMSIYEIGARYCEGNTWANAVINLMGIYYNKL
jgi:hypothetical protein